MKKILKLVLLSAMALFCWFWFANVIFGEMTTRQYVHNLRMEFTHKVNEASAEIVKTIDRMTHDARRWDSPVIV